LKRHCALSEADHKLLEHALERLGLSPRAYHRILKVGRAPIADLAGSEGIKTRILPKRSAIGALDRTMMR
jgi:magnesium chelatase family protein